MKCFALTFAICVALCASRADSQTFTTLLSFTGTGGAAHGENPFGSLTITGTTIYGITSGNTDVTGNPPYGNIFSIGIDGTSYQNLDSFTGTGGSASGSLPQLGSLTASGTTLYGMTAYGGVNGIGNVFSVRTDGTDFQNLVSFTGTGGTASGFGPAGSLTLIGTTLYGMTYQGGANGYGNVFSVGTNGTNYQNLVSFTGEGGTASGSQPFGSLVVSGTTFYGITCYGGANGDGNIFSVGTNGTNYQNLVSFTGTGGAAPGEQPRGSLTLAGTTLYGMTKNGGANADGNIFSVATNGTDYQNLASLTGTAGTAAGLNPFGSLTLAGTTMYGMTRFGGGDVAGNIFSIGSDGSDYQNLYSFTPSGTGGSFPTGDLTPSGGTLFGMTAYGGASSDGTLFALTLPTPTPEPGTLALSSAVAVALVSYRWRRRRLRRENPP